MTPSAAHLLVPAAWRPPEPDHVAVLLPNGTVLTEGGGNCDEQPNPEVHDSASGQFTLTGRSAYPPSSGLSGASASLLPSGNVLITLYVGCDVSRAGEVYDSANGTFAATAKMTADRGYNTSTLLPEERVLIDGRDFTHNDGSAELYDPVAGAFTAIDDISAQSQEGHTATLLPDGSALLADSRWQWPNYITRPIQRLHQFVFSARRLARRDIARLDTRSGITRESGRRGRGIRDLRRGTDRWRRDSSRGSHWEPAG